MSFKQSSNHKQYLATLNKMSAGIALKALELSAIVKKLFMNGLSKRFPDKNKKELEEIYLQRLANVTIEIINKSAYSPE